MAKTPTDRDREYLQAELTRMVGIGRINLGVFQHAVDTMLAAQDIAVLADIHARYIGPPPAEWGPLPQHPTGNPDPQLPQQMPHSTPSPTPPQQQGLSPQQYPQQQMPQQYPQQMPPQQYPPQQYPPQPVNPMYPGQPGYPGVPMSSGQHPGLAQPGMQQPQQEFSSVMGTIKRTGQWLVPERCLFTVNAATLHLDLREATAAAQMITFELRANAAEIKIIVPPGVHVFNHLKETWTDSKINVTAPAAGAPQITLTGYTRGCTLVVETRQAGQKTLWQQFWG
ncbi:hypothetical protein COCCU_09880 [Corynebacterium occultum]|uniref:Uncharacterized protein n=1 Tax=Corynebacterium occultum TaxID=2675219 RepID=A0A6B8WNG6_9CORY|nr:hypothetical protein [Corynebacterium occultum]QGU07898.1 hypothetical protein COCCU_09880 [Corynebacterium occultum]